jgi:hypothetical protein
MGNSDSDDNVVWWVLLIVGVVGGAIWFYFNKSFWPTLVSPVLRCIIAPFVGVALAVIAVVAYFGYQLIYVVLPTIALQIIWKFLVWLTSPRLMISILLIFLLGGASALLFKWILLPLNPLWSTTSGIAAGVVGGFVMMRLTRIASCTSWIVKAIITFPVAALLSYWITLKLMASIEIGWIGLGSIVLLILLGRILWEEDKVEKVVRDGRARETHGLKASELSENMREQVLVSVREQLGDAQYNRLIDSIGRDGVIDLVLKQMSKK